MRKSRTVKIYQAGYVNQAGFNSWDLVATGETIEKARERLAELKSQVNRPDEYYGRYIETYYTETYWD